MTALADALHKAGLTGSLEHWPSEALRQVALNAMVRHADDMEATQYAIFRACRNDPALLRDLLLPWWRQATAMLINDARRNLRSAERKGNISTRKEKQALRVISAYEEKELAQQNKERELELARKAEEDRWNREELNKWLKTKAAQLSIDGVPWWQVTVSRGKAWVTKQTHDTKFMDLVLAGLPEDSRRPISYYRRPEEINDLWDQAYH